MKKFRFKYFYVFYFDKFKDEHYKFQFLIYSFKCHFEESYFII